MILDEIGEMPLEAQVHLLRVLQEHKVQRVGENQMRDTDVRIIAMTNRDLTAEVQSGGFREDLYYRLSVFPIHVPPLRHRPSDIPVLAGHFLREARRRQGKNISGFASDVMDMLANYSWPGNIRELENEIYRAAVFAQDGAEIQTHHFSSKISGSESLVEEIKSKRLGLSGSVRQLQRRMIEAALRECGGNITHAAKRLDIDRANLRAMMKRLGIIS